MNLELKRIFISDVPETATQDAIQNAFENYGEVSSIEIKERKELGVNNTSLIFAYININTDPKHLNNCFNDFSKGKWLGQQVILQLARESFLERLKRERANQNNSKIDSHLMTTEVITKDKLKNVSEKIANGSSKFVPKKYVSFESTLNLSESEKDNQSKINEENKKINFLNEITETDPDLIIKENWGKSQVSKVLKIESVGKKPIIKIEKQKKNVPSNNSEANLKRLESLKNLKREYQNQKSLIQAALSNVDFQPKNKIIFDNASEKVYIKQKTNIKQKNINVNDTNSSTFLFDDSESGEEEFDPIFSVKEHFQGKEGQELLELQSKYKNDKRFTLDERFLDNKIDKKVEKKQKNDSLSNEDISIEEEKNKEYEILEEIFRKNFRKADKEMLSKEKTMLRFDPAQPEHSKYEIPKPLSEKKEKEKKRKNSETEIIEEKRAEKTIAPTVSKEIFFKVSDNLKETFEEKKEFSLLSMFERPKEKDEQVADEAVKIATILKNKFYQEKNPFKYDTSDDEDEMGDVPSKDNSRQQKTVKKPKTWIDPFFFIPDDYRLQEGFDFVNRIGTEEKMEFTKLRRDLKGIVKAKVRNNLRKNKPFKKKLGGNKKKKILRMKKAMKR